MSSTATLLHSLRSVLRSATSDAPQIHGRMSLRYFSSQHHLDDLSGRGGASGHQKHSVRLPGDAKGGDAPDFGAKLANASRTMSGSTTGDCARAHNPKLINSILVCRCWTRVQKPELIDNFLRRDNGRSGHLRARVAESSRKRAHVLVRRALTPRHPRGVLVVEYACIR